MGKKILIVDDAMFMRHLICKALQQENFELLEADNGLKAIEMYEIEKPDLVLLDITMPGLSGLEVLKKLLELDAQAKVIMCSAVGQEQIIKEAIKVGALDFVVKPFTAQSLYDTVRGYLTDV